MGPGSLLVVAAGLLGASEAGSYGAQEQPPPPPPVPPYPTDGQSDDVVVCPAGAELRVGTCFCITGGEPDPVDGCCPFDSRMHGDRCLCNRDGSEPDPETGCSVPPKLECPLGAKMTDGRCICHIGGEEPDLVAGCPVPSVQPQPDIVVCPAGAELRVGTCFCITGGEPDPVNGCCPFDSRMHGDRCLCNRDGSEPDPETGCSVPPKLECPLGARKVDGRCICHIGEVEPDLRAGCPVNSIQPQPKPDVAADDSSGYGGDDKPPRPPCPFAAFFNEKTQKCECPHGRFMDPLAGCPIPRLAALKRRTCSDKNPVHCRVYAGLKKGQLYPWDRSQRLTADLCSVDSVRKMCPRSCRVPGCV